LVVSSELEAYFRALTGHLDGLLAGGEVALCRFSAEDSDFVRFNQAKVRQAMHVAQRYLHVELIEGERHASESLTLTGEFTADRRLLAEALAGLRQLLPYLPPDPHLYYATEVRCTTHQGANALADPQQVIAEVLDYARGTDLVGIYASGGVYEGFASSLGQVNWFESYSHNLDWSLYVGGDKAVKCSYAGHTFNTADFAARMEAAREQAALLSATPRTIEPGSYRVYLAPAAIQEFLDMLSWGGFGEKSHRTHQTPLMRMVEEGVRLHEGVTLLENTADGVAADFQDEGFIKPAQVGLIVGGAFGSCLTSPRSAREYGVPANGASEGESPVSLDMAAGTLARADVLRELGTGLYINNLWYLNYSDRPACRITGMTRFATFWVEGGRIVAPVQVMRFDETIYRVLGDNLVGLTRERDFMLDPMTYGGRSTGSYRVPGALVDGFTITL
jgi:predicted Zn-dependent protease